jgi:hypothetical protein
LGFAPSVEPIRVGIFTWGQEQSHLLKHCALMLELNDGWSPEK